MVLSKVSRLLVLLMAITGTAKAASTAEVLALDRINAPKISPPRKKEIPNSEIEGLSFVFSGMLYGADPQKETYKLCARNLSEARQIAESYVKNQASGAEYAGLPPADRAAMEKMGQELKAQGHEDAKVASVEKNGRLFNIVISQKSPQIWYTQYALYDCHFFEPAKTRPRGSEVIGGDFSGIIGKTQLNKQKQLLDALEFVKFMEHGNSLFQVKGTRTPDKISIRFKRALTHGGDWGMANSNSYHDVNFEFFLSNGDVKVSQKKFAHNEGAINETLLSGKKK